MHNPRVQLEEVRTVVTTGGSAAAAQYSLDAQLHNLVREGWELVGPVQVSTHETTTELVATLRRRVKLVYDYLTVSSAETIPAITMATKLEELARFSWEAIGPPQCYATIDMTGGLKHHMVQLIGRPFEKTLFGKSR